MFAPKHRDHAKHLPRIGGVFGALTGCLGGSMVWASRVDPNIATAADVFVAALVCAAIGWFGTERIIALTAGLRGVSE